MYPFLFELYSRDFPDHIREIACAPEFLRLKKVGMDCGCEYASFPRYKAVKRDYDRYVHSLGTALIVWNFTHDEIQSIAALLHDISTPAFSHSVDFMNGDHVKQESTENGTGDIIRSSAVIMSVLNRLGIDPALVSDYHIYPIADNDSPKLSADRLEYSLGDFLHFSVADKELVRCCYENIIVGRNEFGEEELVFSDSNTAEKFCKASLEISKIFVHDVDRFAMEKVADVLRKAFKLGVIEKKDLFSGEEEVIGKLLSDPRTSGLWKGYCALKNVYASKEQPAGKESFKVDAKRRYIDPYISGMGRASSVFPEVKKNIDAFLAQDFELWLWAD